jgi:hypothetical protein
LTGINLNASTVARFGDDSPHRGWTAVRIVMRPVEMHLTVPSGFCSRGLGLSYPRGHLYPVTLSKYHGITMRLNVTTTWLYSPSWALASYAIRLHKSLSRAFPLPPSVPITRKSSWTSSNHLTLELLLLVYTVSSLGLGSSWHVIFLLLPVIST